MMKKEYITPEVLLRTVFLEGFIADSVPLEDNPIDDPDWDDQESRENNKSFDVWED
jgi:hypothetical protein